MDCYFAFKITINVFYNILDEVDVCGVNKSFNLLGQLWMLRKGNSI